MENLTLQRYYRDEGLRAELEAAARRERAEHVHRLLAYSIETLFAHHPKQDLPRLRTRACG
ncbi:MAG: hypothetical protein ACREUO_03310 [Burkholderiales bacterium]